MPLHSIKINDSYKPKLSLIERLDLWLTYNAPFHSFWRWEVKHRYYKIRDFFFPRQSWVMKGLEKNWVDKTELIPQLLFKCIIHFIEEEEALNFTDWDNSFEGGQAFRLELIECYHWAKWGRKDKQEELNKAYPPAKPFREMFIKQGDGNYVMKPSEKSYDELYGEVNKIEKELDETDEKWLTWIVQNRKYLWV
jgi:hypothetical protein